LFMKDKASLTQSIKDEALSLGFHLVAITSAKPSDHFTHYEAWIDNGYHGEMAYLKKHTEKKKDPRTIVPDAKSIICVALSYKTSHQNPVTTEKNTGLISNYAWGDDYHEIMKEKLSALWEKIKELSPEVRGRYYSDTGPVLERSFAERAGIGWIGKNTCLINKAYGSYVFLGEIILNIELEIDAPETDHCGTCTRCLEACPTDCFVKPYELDATRCISYMTIEKREALSESEQKKIFPYIFGCDICQQVCPWNDKAIIPDLDCFKPRDGNYIPKLNELKGLSQEAFSKKFKKSPIKRAKRAGLIRNVEALQAGQ